MKLQKCDFSVISVTNIALTAVTPLTNKATNNGSGRVCMATYGQDERELEERKMKLTDLWGLRKKLIQSINHSFIW